MMQWCVLRAVHPFPSVAVALTTGALALALHPEHSLAAAAVLTVAMLFIQFSIGLINDVVDAADDAVTKPWKPIAAGQLSRRTAVVATVVLSVAAMAMAAVFGLVSLLFAAGALGCGLVYDLWLKRTPLSWAPLSIALPLLAVWVLVAVDEWRAADGWLLALGPPLGLAIHLGNQAPDIDGDRTRGVAGIAHRLGVRESLLAAHALLLAVVVGGAAVIGVVRGAGEALAVVVGFGLLVVFSAALALRWRAEAAFPAQVLLGAALAVALLVAVHA